MIRAFALIALALVACACSDDVATSPPASAIEAFQLSHFRGTSRSFTSEVANTVTLPGPCEEVAFTGFTQAGNLVCMTSFRLSGGATVTVFALPNFQGPSTTFSSDVADLRLTDRPCDGSWHFCIGSFRLR